MCTIARWIFLIKLRLIFYQVVIMTAWYARLIMFLRSVTRHSKGIWTVSVADKAFIKCQRSIFLVTFPDKINQGDLIKQAENEGVRVYYTMQFWQEKAACSQESFFLGSVKLIWKISQIVSVALDELGIDRSISLRNSSKQIKRLKAAILLYYSCML